MFEIVGFTHMQGTSKKTGNAYNFYNCHLLSDRAPRGGEGRQVLEYNVRGDVPGAEKIKVGCLLDILYGGDVVIHG